MKDKENKLIEFIGYAYEFKRGNPEKKIINVDNIQSISRYYYPYNNNDPKVAINKAPSLSYLYFDTYEFSNKYFRLKTETIIKYGERDKQEIFYGVEPYEVICEKIANVKNGFSVNNIDVKDKYFLIENENNEEGRFINLKEIPRIIVHFKYDKEIDPITFIKKSAGKYDRQVFLYEDEETRKELYCNIQPYSYDSDSHKVSIGLKFCHLEEWHKNNILLKDELEELLKNQKLQLFFKGKKWDGSSENIWIDDVDFKIGFME